MFKNYCWYRNTVSKHLFLDDKGNLTGYDVELVRAIDEKLPEYKFEFKTMEFSNLLLSLETRKIDFIAHQMEVNSEREEKFYLIKSRIMFSH